MLDVPVYATTAILALLAVSEVVSVLTRAYVPSLLVALVGYLVLLWTGVFPPDLVPKSTLAAVGSLAIGAVITHMGTLIPLRQIRSQYKAILIALGGVVVATGLLLAVVTPLFGYAQAVAGAGPSTGGLLAYLITQQQLTKLGLTHLVVVSALVLGLHGLVGLPLANVLLRRYAVRFRDAGGAQREVVAATAGSSAAGSSAAGPGAAGPVVLVADVPEDGPGLDRGRAPAPPQRQLLPQRFHQPFLILLLLFASASLATWLGSVTGVNLGLFALLIGLGGRLVGVLPERSLERANSFGLALLAVIVAVLAGVSGVRWADVVSAIGPVLVIMVVGASGVVLGGAVVSRLVGWDPRKGVPVALTALFGFPGDFLLCQEVSRSVGRTERERAAILDEILTPMLVGGFTTVTTASIFIASLLVQTL